MAQSHNVESLLAIVNVWLDANKSGWSLITMPVSEFFALLIVIYIIGWIE